MGETMLKPCPFCGGEPKIQFGWPAQQRKGAKMVFIKCKSCNCKTQTAHKLAWATFDDSIQAVVNLWNRRAVASVASEDGCEFCKVFDFGCAKCDVDKFGASVVNAGGTYRFPEYEQFNFCPNCGRSLRQGG